MFLTVMNNLNIFEQFEQYIYLLLDEIIKLNSDIYI